MDFGSRIDQLIEPFAPGWVADRQEARNRIEAQRIVGEQVRQFDAAQSGRRTANWPRSATSANGELIRGGQVLARAAHDLVRNNKYAAAGIRQLVGMIWGDGISPQFSHSSKVIQQLAQDEWDRWAEGKVDGVGDWYGHAQLIVREMTVGGDGLTLWGAKDGKPNEVVVGLEGAQLDPAKTLRLRDGAKISQGVEVAFGNTPRAYWIFPEHPHETMLSRAAVSQRIAAANVDHVFERQRLGQVRGMSWMHAVALTLRDISEIEDAARMREKIQACLALVLTPPSGEETSALSTQSTEGVSEGGNAIETIRPGMIMRAKNGEQVHTIDPKPSQNTVNFIKQQLAGVSANMAPYHLMTGDVSQANYSSLRAAMNGAYTNVDSWQTNVVIPLLCRPAVERRLAMAAIKTGKAELLECKVNYALPVRRMVDPVKDAIGEIMAIRAGLRTLKKAIAERGENVEEHLADIKAMNDQIDAMQLALDTDPRKIMNSGKLQDPVGYLGTGPAPDDDE